ncbi:PAAR-like domain-containing protein, partial [Vibrio sp. V39_P1S14PM300]|uniref:PAAR-like domain-containing protein n=1 Tax=Vibrio sp. V39_P1S14PM300 TaxID=1938690 RepID=UPI001372F8BF
MAVTINANGLSVVHKGSGGEANASVPDVCLTKVGKPVVPIPYGNNAKSSDLADGSATVVADGGNSIALKGSKFSKSTGDAAGDKKGVASGTIEAEAEFVTASSNVLIEGKGVARHSDQMTMNKANTMCFGVQNPSVSVDEEAESECDLHVCVRYPNGQRLTNAEYALKDEGGASLGAGQLDERGKSSVSGLKPGKAVIQVEESRDDYALTPVRRENPHYLASIPDGDFFDIASKGQRGFWQPTRIETGLTPWGSIGQCLSSDVFFQDIVEAETKRHFRHLHPETTYNFGTVSDAVIGNLNMPFPHTTETLLAYSMPLSLEEGELLSVLLRLAPHETTDRMLAYMRARGTGNPQSYLGGYDWRGAEKTMNDELDSLIGKIKQRLAFLKGEASKLQYAYLSEEVFDKHIDTISTYAKGLPDLVSGVFTKMKSKASTLLSNTSNVNVIKAPDNTYSAEAGVIEAVVNTTQSVDLVEPYMNEVPGKIDNVLPIYPVRYGYANFFDTILPAQAPPTLPEMASASGLNETGGYILRLLREGWIYIKEEGDKDQLHIFHYAQTETATGVIEKFEKYYFTNEENAQDGLTLDTSSGSTFYPFAFVTAGTKQISIAYSEHEWSADIIDKMNTDLEWRSKAIQNVDFSTVSTDFSVAASQDTLINLVEDYRSHDNKWLSNKKDRQPNPLGLDVFTTQNNYHLSAEGIVATMQQSHSDEKDGTLIALFDPVGRQSDIAFSLTLLFGIEQSEEASKVYPKTIGEFILQLNQGASDSEPIQTAINENINVAELTRFYQESRETTEALKARRAEYLDLFSAFAYQDLADGTVGSLDNYLEMFFDSNAPTDPFKELQKLNAVMSAMLDGIGSSKEGQNTVVSMINAAYEQGTHNVYLTYEDKLKIILLQCQDHVDWADLATELADNTPNALKFLWSWTAATARYGKGRVIQSALKLKPVAYMGLLDFIPVFFEKGFGIKEVDGTVRITLDELGRILAKNIDTGGQSHFPMLKAQAALPFARRLIHWGDEQRITTLPELRKAAESYPAPKLTLPNYSHRYASFDAESHLALLGKSLDGALSMVSLRANMDVLVQLTQSSAFEHADPTKQHDWVTSTQSTTTALAALSAAVVDHYGVRRTQLLLAKKTLNSNRFYFAVKSGLPSLLGAVTRGGAKSVTSLIDSRLDHLKMLSEAKVFSRLIAASNLALLVSSTFDAIDAHDSGNRGLMYAYVNQMISYSMFAVGPILTLRNISSATINSGYFALIGFALLLVAEGMRLKYSKTELEQLLFSCFWGNSEKYPFWGFREGGKLSISKRISVSNTEYDDRKI